MKKILMAIVALIVSTGAFAQGFGGQFNPEDMAKFQAQHIQEVCKTDTAQTRKITEYLVKSTKQMMEQMQNNQGGFDMEGFRKRQEEQNAFLKATLNEEQFKLYTEDQKKMMERFRQGGGGF